MSGGYQVSRENRNPGEDTFHGEVLQVRPNGICRKRQPPGFDTVDPNAEDPAGRAGSRGQIRVLGPCESGEAAPTRMELRYVALRQLQPGLNFAEDPRSGAGGPVDGLFSPRRP